jgi:hypothetical protein
MMPRSLIDAGDESCRADRRYPPARHETAWVFLEPDQAKFFAMN